MQKFERYVRSLGNKGEHLFFEFDFRHFGLDVAS